jgi:hypothetical protein
MRKNLTSDIYTELCYASEETIEHGSFVAAKYIIRHVLNTLTALIVSCPFYFPCV